MKHQVPTFTSLLLILSAVHSLAAEAEFVNYVITASGTSNGVSYPPQSFSYTVTGIGTETWSEVVNTNRSLSFEVENNEFGTTGRSFSFVPPLSG